MRKKLRQALESGDWHYFYNSRTWRNKAKQIIRRDNNECQQCKARGRFHKAECVHHIKHLQHRPDLALDDDNLISLCLTCHNLEHPEKFMVKKKEKSVISEEMW